MVRRRDRPDAPRANKAVARRGGRGLYGRRKCPARRAVGLPEAFQPRDRWLARSEAARLIWAVWRHREVKKGKMIVRRSRQHVARFILVTLYTGSRAGAVCGASIGPVRGSGLIDAADNITPKPTLVMRSTKRCTL